MPSRLAPPIPAKKLSGILMTKAQGQLATRKVNARYSYTLHPASSPNAREITGGRTAKARALKHTTGV